MKKQQKKLAALLAAAMVVGGSVMGCSSNTTENNGGTPESVNSGIGESEGISSEEEITLTFWDGNWQESVWPEVEALWNEEHPNIKIDAEFQADLANDKYMLALTNDTAPDVMACALDWVTTFGSAGLLAPLDEYVTKDSLDIDQYVKGAIDSQTVDGNLYGLPFRTETYTLFYNKDLLAEAGYTEAPKTWDDVKEIAAACTNGDVYGYGLCGTNYSNFSFQYITMLECSGGSLLNDDNSASELKSDVAVQTAQLYKDLMEYAPASVLENDNVANRTLFASGKIAMYLSGIYDAEEIEKMNPDLNYGCAVVPTANGAEPSTILGGWSVAVSGCSKQKEAAWEFVKFLTRPDVAAIYTNTFTGSGEVAARYMDYPEEITKPNAEALQYAHALPSVENIVAIRQAIMDNLQLMLTEDMSAEGACVLLDEAVNGLLE